MNLPPALIFINDIGGTEFLNTLATNNDPGSDVSPAPTTIKNLINQLHIDDSMTKAEFDARVVADPNYPTIIHLQGLRILVILPTLQDYSNRVLADVVLFGHQGLVDIEYNRFGTPCQSFEIQRINIYDLLRAAHSRNVVTLPFDCMPHCGTCNYPFYCDTCHTFSGIKICNGCSCEAKCGCGIIDNQGREFSPVHLPNCDNEYHNRAFIHRK